jgi:galactose mutarotase-like enzyme
MIRSIENGQISISVDDLGAELVSLLGPDRFEYLWQADPAVWPRHAPVLFPIVGRLKGNRYRFDDREFEMRQHGFARDSRFSPTVVEPQSLRYRLEDSPATRDLYPFEFVLDIVYRLRGLSVEITYEVTNPGRTQLLFSIGAHPGFALSWEAGDAVEDYFLEFERPENVDTWVSQDGCISDSHEPLLRGDNRLPLTRHSFDRDALVLTEHESRSVTIGHRRSSRRLTVEFNGFPALGIWAKPGAPFVCIEPWFGHADTVGSAGRLEEKPGIVRLGPGEQFACTHRISLAAR